MMSVHPTQSGKVFLGLSGLLYLAALTSQSSILLFMVGIVLGCFIVNALAAWSSLKHLELRPPKSVLLSEGQKWMSPWTISNRGRKMAAFLVAESPQAEIFRLPKLDAAQEIQVVPELCFTQRGVYHYAQVKLSSFYPFGLIRANRSLDLPGEVVVAPAIYEVEAPLAAGFDVMVGGKHKGKHGSTSGADFSGVRPLQPGDPWKQIHWRSSAKGQGLMVKTFDEELSGRVSFILDCGHTGKIKTLDACLRATGSLMLAALAVGHHVEWIDLIHLEIHLMPPLSDGEGLLDALARIEMAPGCLTKTHLDQALAGVSHKSAIHLMLTGYDPSVQLALENPHLQRRLIRVYLPEGCAAPPLESGSLAHYSEMDLLV